MARGWESKDVESQREAAEWPGRAGPAARSKEQMELEGRLRSLQLSRQGLLHEIEAARHPRHRAQLELALDYVDGQIRELAEGK